MQIDPISADNRIRGNPEKTRVFNRHSAVT
jgi:hypothetical protein